MFSGIIEELGSVVSIGPKGEGARLTIEAPKLRPGCAVGDSVAVNGVCLTIEAMASNTFGFDLSPETLKATNLGSLKPGEKINLEQALAVGDRLGGHFVQGHVDSIGRIVKRIETGAFTIFEISAEPEIVGLLIDKGSISVDGISLTVTKILPRGFEVVIIPHTALKTTLGFKGVGREVNLEADMIGKYVAKLTKPII